MASIVDTVNAADDICWARGSMMSINAHGPREMVHHKFVLLLMMAIVVRRTKCSA